MNKFNTYLANLAVLNVKFHNVHWNVVGKQFVQVHEFTESLYDVFFEQYDAVAEALKMRNVYPVASLKEYLELTTVKEIESKDYSVEEVIDLVESELKALCELATSIRNEADEANDFVLVAQFEDYIAGFQKNLWFIKAMKA